MESAVYSSGGIWTSKYDRFMYLFQFAKAETVGKRLKAMREFLDMSQEELSAASGVSWNTILRMEKHTPGQAAAGDTSIKLDNFLALCSALAKQLNVEPEIVAAIAVGGRPLAALVQLQS